MFGRRYKTLDDIDSSVQMKLYTLSKRQLVLVFFAFFIAVLLTLLIGLNGPDVCLSDKTSSSSLPSVKNLERGPFIVNSPFLSAFNQQLYLICTIHLNHTKPGRFTEPMEMDVSILGKERDLSYVVNAHTQSRHRLLVCEMGECEDLLVMHLGHLKYSLYTVTVGFEHLDDILPHKISEVVFTFNTFNPSFTQLEIWFRFFFLVTTFLVICMFAHPMRKFAIKDWSIEQRWLVLLLPLLLLYNNPLFPMTFLVESWVPNMLDALFQTLFIAALLLFWVCTYHGLRVSDRPFGTFYLPKMILVFCIWFIAFFFACWEGYHKVSDPTYSTDIDFSSHLTLKVTFFVLCAIYVLYLLFLVIRACTELNSLPYFDIRLKFLTSLTFLVVIASCTLFFVRYGIRLTDTETFAGSISSRYGNSAEFLFLYGLLNFYLYTMAFVYSPSKNADLDSHFRDNPTFSMLNDESDDEVVYGGRGNVSNGHALVAAGGSSDRHQLFSDSE